MHDSNIESKLTATVICRYYSSGTPELKTVIMRTANINGGKLSTFSSKGKVIPLQAWTDPDGSRR
jgi:hypothetical protein